MFARIQRWFHDWRWLLTCGLAGAMVPLSLAPFNLWPIAIPALAVLAFALQHSNGKGAYWRSWWFGIGLYGVGVSWVFVSIATFGNAPLPFAALLTGLLVLVMATIFALPFYLYGRWCPKHVWSLLLVVPALWVLGEWLRTWLFTGFPWLFLGYGHINTWLAGWAPVGGVISISFAVALTGSFLTAAYLAHRQVTHLIGMFAVVAALWLGGWAGESVEWTQDYRKPVSVGVVQGNIPQERKWDDDFVQPTLDRYFNLSEPLWSRNDWVVWPEAAIPLIMNFSPHTDRLKPALDKLRNKALASETAFITGILYLSPFDSEFYNSMVAFGLGSGIYHKRRLTPFGDYVPLSDWFGPVLAVFNLPHSILELGPKDQRGLQAGDSLIAPAICYEIAYPGLVAKTAVSSHALITVSNDAWFGRSLGPIQHMQIAQMRALETRRFLVRATNNGISGIVDDRGQMLVKSKQFVQQTLETEIRLKQGATPFMRWRSLPIILLATAIVLVGIGRHFQEKKKEKELT